MYYNNSVYIHMSTARFDYYQHFYAPLKNKSLGCKIHLVVKMEIKILYSDNDIAVCIKPLGKDSEKDMPGLLQSQLGAKEAFCVHRLDMAVGGVMVYALNKKAAAGLSNQIAGQQMKKEYLAIIQGCPEEKSCTLRDLLFRDRAKNKSYVVKRKRAGVKDAELEYDCIESKEDKTLLHKFI